MSKEPAAPEPWPEVPKGAMWRSLAIPPLVTLAGNLIIVSARDSVLDEAASLLLAAAGFLVIVICLACFNAAVGKRYRGQSKVFLGWFYFLGQVIVCLAIGLGFSFLFTR
jgi:hypothetical protein